MREKLVEEFIKIYGDAQEVQMFFSPGRVNLIGEHTDYNGGHVFPCALTLGTYALVRLRSDTKMLFYSLNIPSAGIVEADTKDVNYKAERGWANYMLGVLWALQKEDYTFAHGFELLLYGTIPNGAGLSSSASLEVLMGYILQEMYALTALDKVKIALTGQYAENQYIGMKCGIMDQFTVAMGQREHAIFLDTATLEYQYVPVKLTGMKIVIINSKVKHSLVDSAYNERREQCEEALEDLQSVVQIASLGELDEAGFEAHSHAIRNPIARRRAKHAVYENRRTIRAVEALHRDDIDTFAELMNETHISLRDDFEVSCKEIDLLVELAQQHPSVKGARLTGGGFGGCTVNIVEEEGLEEVLADIKEKYTSAVGILPESYIVEIGDGVHRITE
ncbi:MAG: galactokinase [Lachnospiraceae bacterium]